MVLMPRENRRSVVLPVEVSVAARKGTEPPASINIVPGGCVGESGLGVGRLSAHEGLALLPG